MTALRVGLTGGIAAGKSTVAAWLQDAGLRVVDADRLVARLYRPGGEGAAAVARLFGSDCLRPDGGVDHARLAARIFDDVEARRQLEEAIHPLVKRDFEALARATAGVIVLEAPLLVEAGFAKDFDVVVTVEADAEERLQRAVARGLDRLDAERRLAAQSAPGVRLRAAHIVVRNDGSLEDLRREVDGLVADLERRALHAH